MSLSVGRTERQKRAKEVELNEEEQSFSARLVAEMEKRQMTQEALAKAAGISQPAVSNIINRKCRPQHRTVLRFAEVLGVAPELLWPGISPAQFVIFLTKRLFIHRAADLRAAPFIRPNLRNLCGLIFWQPNVSRQSPFSGQTADFLDRKAFLDKARA